MAHVVIAQYRPKPGKDAELLDLVRGHAPALRGLGLATEREAVVLRAADGTLLEIFEWTSTDAVERAHHDPAVQALWARFEEVSAFGTLSELAEAKRPFPHFEWVEL
jgi:quinol monooxygenase YgiN